MTVLDARVSDGELLGRFAARDAMREEVFAELVRRHLGWVYGAARRMTGDAGLAEDVAQGVFLAMSEKAAKLAGHACLVGWLFEATRLGSSMVMRGRRREKERARVVAAELAKREVVEGADVELLARVDAAVVRLREGERRVVLLHFYSGMSVGEVGAAMGLSEGAVRKRLWRAMEKLRGWLGVRGDAVGFMNGGVMAGLAGVEAPGGIEKIVLARQGSAGAVHVAKAIFAHGVAKAGLLYSAVACVCVMLGIVSAIVAMRWGGARVRAGTAVVVGPVAASGPTTEAVAAGIHTVKKVTTRTINGVADAGYVLEEYCDRDQGSLTREIYPHGVYITRSDGIEYREGGTMANRVLPMTTQELRREQESLAYQFNNLFVEAKSIEARVPEKDVVVGGKRLMCYAMKTKGEDEWYEWADERGVRVREEYTSRRWNEVDRSEWSFNPELPGDFWKMPASVKVVEPFEVVGKAFPLAGAVFQREVHGTIVAVHSVRQDEDGVFYLVVSARLTEGTFKGLESATATPEGGKRGRIGMPNLLAWDEGAQKLTREYRDRTIAWILSDGIWVGYVAAVARDPATEGNRCALAFDVSPIETADELTGKTPPKRMFVSFDLRASGKVTGEEFAGEAYDAMSSVDKLGLVHLSSSSVPNKWKPRKTTFEPAEVGKEEFEAGAGKDVVRLGGVP